jgi:ABC-type transport system substrate-binding protein
MKRVVNVRWFALVLALAMSVTACTTPDPDATDTTAAPASTTTTEASTDTTEPAGPAGRTVLEVVIPTDPVAMNPFPETAGNRATVHMAMFLPLIEVDNEQAIHSKVLESWEVSSDATTITLTVRDGIEWSDGTPITSADVSLALHLHLDSRISTRAGRLGGVAGVAEYSEGTADSISGIRPPTTARWSSPSRARTPPGCRTGRRSHG